MDVIAKKRKYIVMNSSAKKDRRIRYALVVITGLYCLLTFAPLYFVIINSFKSNSAIIANPFILHPKEFTFDSFTSAYNLLKFPVAFKNSSLLLIISLSMVVTSGSLAGFSIATARSKFLNFYLGVLIALQTLPFLLGMVPSVVQLKYLGLQNNIIGTSLILAAFSLPFTIFLYTGYMRSLPQELYEAAVVDGCSFIQSYLYVYMPLLKAVTGTVIILQGVGIWNDFLISYVTLGTAKNLPLIPRLFAFSSGRTTRYDLLFAGTFLVSIPIVIVFLAFQRVFVDGIVAGSVKG